MTAGVIATIHQLATACKKCKGITLSNKDGNIIRDDEDTEDNISGNSENTGMDAYNNETQAITGLPQTNIKGKSPKKEGNANYDEGNMDNDKGNAPEDKGNANTNEGDMAKNEDKITPSHDKEYCNTHYIDDDKISFENGSPEDPKITINDIKHQQ